MKGAKDFTTATRGALNAKGGTKDTTANTSVVSPNRTAPAHASAKFTHVGGSTPIPCKKKS